MKKICLLLSLMLLSLVGSAEEVEINGICYNLNSVSKTASVTSKSPRYEGNIVLPETINYESIQYSVTSIGENAFSSCSGLTSITISNSITNIGYYAFRNCSGLTYIAIPNSVTSIGYDAFYGCSGLTSITVDSNNTAYDSRENCNALIKTSNNMLLLGCQNTVIPSSTTSIGAWAFYGCTDLTSITIPNSVTSIGDRAFEDCSGLTSITIPNSVTSIGKSAFEGCNLTSVTVFCREPISIKSKTFSNRANATLYVNAGCKSAYESASYWSDFGEIIELKSGDTFVAKTIDGVDVVYEIIDEEEMTCMVGYTYDKKKGIRQAIATSTTGSITIPSGVNGYNVTYISAYAFNNCNKLTSIFIPDGVTSFGGSAFSGCTNAETIRIPNSVTSGFGSHTFTGCQSLTTINIPEGVQIIGDLAFASCNSLTSVTLPSTVKTIYEQAFSECSNLTSVQLSDNLELIGASAFSGCKLTSLTLPEKFTTSYGIDYISYSGTQIGTIQTLNKVVIKKGVSSLYEVFRNCYYVETVICYNEEPVNAYNCWKSNTGILYVPKGSKAKYEADDNWNKFSHIIEMEEDYSYEDMGDTFVDNNITYKMISPCPREAQVGMSSSKYKAIDDMTEGDIIIPSSLKNPNDNRTYSITSIGSYAFYFCSNITSVRIPNTIKEIGRWAFSGCNSLTSVTLENNIPISIHSETFSNYSNATLYVPIGSKALYEETDVWKDFKEIVEYTPVETISLSSAGVRTFSSSYMLYFPETSDLKAYIASDYNSSTGELTMTRVYNTPAGEGLFLKGAEGVYEVSYAPTNNTYTNLLRGVTIPVVIEPTEGDYTNYILANGTHGIGFYTLSKAGVIFENKAYLQIPTASLNLQSRNGISMIFNDEQDDSHTTGISEQTSGTKRDGYYYDLFGRQVKCVDKGLYIKNGKKILVK